MVIKTGQFNDLESLTTLSLLTQASNNIVLTTENTAENIDLQENYLAKNFLEINNLEKKVLIIIGSNIRLENPILNIKLRKLSKKKSILIGFVGPKSNINIEMTHLGTNINALFDVVSGRHPFVKTIENFLKKNNTNQKLHSQLRNKIELIFGNQFLQLKSKSKILESLQSNQLIKNKFNINVITSTVGEINKKELGLVGTQKNYSKGSNLYYLLGSETITGLHNTDFVIYQGTHNEKIRTKFDVILPTLN
jgi:NADH dehydrogenase/NADH:ubiquinone oxidoreductase subunit G